MKLHIQIFFILIVFFKTETLLSENNLFNVNNISLEKKDKNTNSILANQGIKKGFEQLINKILLKEDINKFSDLNFSSIKKLVSFYQISNLPDVVDNQETINFSVTFDKQKIHNLFYKKGISYSEISDKEFYILPILIKKNEIFIFNNNFFYENWNNQIKDKDDLLEFILPLENIEIIQNINNSKNNLLDLQTDDLLKEYPNKNKALVFIEDSNISNKKVYFKTKIQGKNISRGINFKKQNLETRELYKEIIDTSKEEIINLVKSENLIDIRTPSFLKIKLILNKKTSLVDFNARINQIDLIENIYVQDFNKDYINVRIKYLGKLEKILKLIKDKNINLQFINDQWIIKKL